MGGPVWPPVKRRKVFINYRRIKYFPLRAKPAKRARWAKQREQKGTPKNAVFWGRGEADKRLRNTAKRCSEKSRSCRDEAPRSKYSRRMPQNILGTARVQWHGEAMTKGCFHPHPSFRPLAENPPSPKGRLPSGNPFCGTVRTVPYFCHCGGASPWQSVKEYGFFAAFRMMGCPPGSWLSLFRQNLRFCHLLLWEG